MSTSNSNITDKIETIENNIVDNIFNNHVTTEETDNIETIENNIVDNIFNNHVTIEETDTNITKKKSNNETNNKSNKKNTDIKKQFFTFTLNNYTKEDENIMQKFATKYCKYLIYGREIAPTTGTKHLQGACCLNKQQRLKYIKNTLVSISPNNRKSFFNTIHVEPCIKSIFANSAYCKKTGDYWEFKIPGYTFRIPKQINNKNKQELKYKEAIELAIDDKYDQIDPKILITHQHSIKNIKYLFNKNYVERNLLLGSKYGNFFKNHFLFLHGSTGTLKSYNAHKINTLIYKFLLHYNKTNNLEPPNKFLWETPYIKDTNKWWQNYKYEKVVIVEEVDNDFCMRNASRIKKWIDQYYFPAEIKGSDANLIRPEFIIFTSNYTIEECFTDINSQKKSKELEPIMRRFCTINLEEKKILKWPNIQLLIIEYNNKNLAKQYDKQYEEELYNLQKDSFDLIDKQTIESGFTKTPQEISNILNNIEWTVPLKRVFKETVIPDIFFINQFKKQKLSNKGKEPESSSFSNSNKTSVVNSISNSQSSESNHSHIYTSNPNSSFNTINF